VGFSLIRHGAASTGKRIVIDTATSSGDIVAPTVARHEALQTWLMVSGVFVGVSLLSVPIPGVNEPHYLSKARSFADSEWCRNDFFLQSADAHAVFFAVVGPATKILSSTATILIGRILSLMLLAWGWKMLGQQLQLPKYQIVMAACGFCLIGMTGNFSGEWVIGGFESKVPAYGCALTAVAFWLKAWCSQKKRTYAVAGIMAGLAVSWHPVVGLWFCIGIAATELILAFPGAASGAQDSDFTMTLTDRLHNLIMNGITFVVVSICFAVPGLIPALRVVMASDLSREELSQADYIQVFWRLAHHLDPSSFPVQAWIHSAILSGICVGGLVWLAFRNLRTPTVGRSAWWPLIGLLAAAAITAAAGVMIGWHDGKAVDMPNWQLRAFLLKFYPFRFFDALLPVTTALLAAKLLAKHIAERIHRMAVCVLVIATLTAAHQQQPQAPSAYTSGTYAAWMEACVWLKHNTPPDSLIYGPRESFGLKLFAERAEYVCFKDCPQDAAGILEWNRRLWRVHHWSAVAYADQVYQDSDFATLREKTGVTHVLTKRLGPFTAKPVWQNSVWRIYETNSSPDGKEPGRLN
jgi:hypothetical protein